MTGELLRARDVLQTGQRVDFYTEDDELERYESRIVKIGSQRMLVSAPKDRTGEALAIQPMSDFKGLIVEKTCRYVFSTTFEEQKDEGSLSYWSVKMPEKIIRYQNRGYVRVKANLELIIRLVDEEGTIGDPMKVPMVDLSGGGLCFVMNRSVAPGVQVGMELRNIPEIGTLEVMGRVVRCMAIDTSAKYPIYHVGVVFGDLPRAVTNKIVRYLFTLQREALAKGVSGVDL